MVKVFLNKHGKSLAKATVSLAILAFIIYSLSKEIQSLDFAKTFLLIRELPIQSLFLMTAVGILAVSAITIYDFLIVRYLKLDIDLFTIFNVSFIASTINNISGLGALTGASIRSVMFKKGDQNTDILDYNLLLVPSIAVGLGVFTLFSLLFYRYLEPIIEKYNFIILAIIGFIIYLASFFFVDIVFYKLTKKEKHVNDSKRFILKLNLLLSSTLQWILSFTLFVIIVKHFDSDIEIAIIFPIYTLGCIATIISMLPGGVGSLDLIVLAGLQSYGVLPEHILASLILYRVFYYFIPLIVSIIINLIAQAVDKSQASRIFDTTKFKGVVSWTTGFTTLLLSILVLFSGLVLLFSALVPGIAERIKFASELLEFPIMQLSHQLSIIIGIILVNISREIRLKVKRAYTITLWFLILGMIFTFLKGFDYEEALFLLIVLILLRVSKDSFYRKSIPIDWYGFITSAVITLFGIAIYLRISHLIISDFLRISYFKTIFTKEIINLSPNGIITYIVFILYLIISEITKKTVSKDERYEELDENKLQNFLDENPGSFQSHLIYLKDKHLYWANNNKVLIAFEKSHNIIVVMGDPIGDANFFDETINEFNSFIDEYGLKSVYYEVSESLMPLFFNNGYYFLKLGETALVDLEAYDIKNPNNKDFRNILNRFHKDGYYFEIIEGDNMDDKIYDQLKDISKEWLNSRNEMGFSLGFFDRNYLERSPIALVKKIEDQSIIAFVSLMPKYDGKSFSIDLMRHRDIVPSNTMAYLIISLILDLKAKEYKVLNLGMAPLANVGIANNAKLKERIAHLVFKFSKEIYSFSGLKQFKKKFNPSWESRYLAYEDFTMLPASIIEATRLIHAKKDRQL